MSKNSLYEQVSTILEKYLGPAGDRFARKHIEFHLNKKAEELEKADLSRLQEWVSVSLAMLTDDDSMVDECIKELEKLQTA